MKLLIIDTETSGIDSKIHHVVEVGAILYSVSHQTILYQISSLLNAPHNEAENINRIPEGVLKTIPELMQRRFIKVLQSMAEEANFIVAHNASFDKQWFDEQHLPILKNFLDEPIPWLCTMEDFIFPKQHKPIMSLVDLALSHGIGVNSNHRALTDCQLIAALFERMDDLDNMVNHANRPKSNYKAEVTFEQKDLAKMAGFQWNSIEKIWSRRMAKDDIDKLAFNVTEIF